MKWTIFLLALTAGLTLAAEETKAEDNEEDRALDPFSILKKTILAPLFAPAKVLVNIGLEVVVTIALSLLIAQLAKQLDLASLFDETGTGSGYGYEYGYPPAICESHGGSASGGSSYTSTGHSPTSSYTKRAAVENSFSNHPLVQRLTARVHEAIDSFNP